MEIGDNLNNNDSSKNINSQATSGMYWCFLCDYELDANHICWNTDWDGNGNPCPNYGIPQA